RALFRPVEVLAALERRFKRKAQVYRSICARGVSGIRPRSFRPNCRRGWRNCEPGSARVPGNELLSDGLVGCHDKINITELLIQCRNRKLAIARLLPVIP